MPKKIIVNESIFKDLILNEIREYGPASPEEIQAAKAPYVSWYKEHTKEDGWIDYDLVTKECIELLKHSNQVLSMEHQRIRLDNDCKILLGEPHIQEQDLYFWEIQLPGPWAQCFDGAVLDDPDLDNEMQEELAYHFLWK